MKFKESLDRRASLLGQSTELLNKVDAEKREMNAEEQKIYDSMLGEIEVLSKDITKMEEELYGQLGLTKVTDEVVDRIKPGSESYSPNKQIKFYSKNNLKEFKSKLEPGSLGKVTHAMITGDWSRCSREQRDAIGESGQGIWLINQELSRELIQMALAEAQVVNAGGRFVEMKQAELLIPKITQMPDYEYKGENEAYTSNEDIHFTGVLLESRTLMSVVKLSVELAEDGYDVQNAIQTAMAKAVSQGIDLGCLSGTGLNNQPKGIINQDNILEEDCEDTPLENYDHFSSAYFKLQGQNINPNALIAPSSLLAQVDLLKDTNDGQPLRPPESWSKYQKLSSNQLVDNAILGDFSRLLIGMRTNARFEMTRLSDTAFQNMQVWLRIYCRFDVALALPEAFCNIKDFLEIGS